MSQLKLTIVGDPTPLRNATKKAEASLRNMSKVTQNVSNSMNKSLGAVGLGFGLATLVTGLKNATKAASEDRKGQGLLAQALQKTVGANAQAIAGAEAYVKKTQLQTSVLDDELRPALATAVRATGSLAVGQRLLDAALDVSASTGKDLGSVTGALSKAFNGNTGALKKLVPGLKLTGDVLADVEAGFDGAAEKAADLDPYKRLEVIFADIQETVGTQLLPVLEQFTAYLTSPEGQQNLQQIVGLFVDIGNALATVIGFLIQNIDLVKACVAAIVVLRLGWALSLVAVQLYEAGVIKATTATKAMKYALISTGIGAVIAVVATLASSWLSATEAQDAYVEGQPQIPASPTTSDPLNPVTIANQQRIQKINAAADKIKKALQAKIEEIKKTAEQFRDAVGLAFGTFGKDENSVFNVDVIINKLKRVVGAAKGFAENIAKLRKAGADESVISEIVGMGPAQGNIVAKGLLGSGKLSEYLKLRGSLYQTGAQAGAQAAITGNATYEININKAIISAADIIREIKIYEKKTGSRYLVSN